MKIDELCVRIFLSSAIPTIVFSQNANRLESNIHFINIVSELAHLSEKPFILAPNCSMDKVNNYLAECQNTNDWKDKCETEADAVVHCAGKQLFQEFTQVP